MAGVDCLKKWIGKAGDVACGAVDFVRELPVVKAELADIDPMEGFSLVQVAVTEVGLKVWNRLKGSTVTLAQVLTPPPPLA